jgi:predicted flap endonuclease-1-like 5' DNA nuclease
MSASPVIGTRRAMGWYAVQLIWLVVGAFAIGLLTGYLWWILGYQHRRAAEGVAVAAMRTELERAAEERRDVDAELAKVRADHTAVRTELTERDERIATHESTLAGLRGSDERARAATAALDDSRASAADVRRERDDLAAELASLRAQHDGAQLLLIDLRTQYDTVRSELATLRSEFDGAQPYQIDLRSGPEPRSGVDDDLERIEGIGPRIAEILRAQGICSFAQLARSDADELRAALERGGLRFAPSLGTWAAQAGYLARGDAEGFADYTGLLIGGRESGAPGPDGPGRSDGAR